jgi:hypothetical protein
MRHRLIGILTTLRAWRSRAGMLRCGPIRTRFSRVSKNPIVPAKVQAAWRLMQDDPKQTLQTAEQPSA